MSDKYGIDSQAFAKALQSGKTVKTASGEFELETPRDCNG